MMAFHLVKIVLTILIEAGAGWLVKARQTPYFPPRGA
jgi:hypothetical protein